MAIQPGVNEPTLSVSDVHKLVNGVLDDHIGRILIEGEIHEYQQSSAGHIYLTLKDERSEIRCVRWRSTIKANEPDYVVGDKVLIRAQLTVWNVAGRFQAIVDYIEHAGEGQLRAEFEKLKAKLEAEGLFDESRKKPLPVFPRAIALITARDGMALKDFAEIARRRFPLTQLRLIPTSVQGANAPEEIQRGIHYVSEHPERWDIAVVLRGGGSLTDLSAFNAESVARAIVACRVPIVSAIGHQADVVISDYVADLRAATPSEAAELITPNSDELNAELSTHHVFLRRTIESLIGVRQDQLDLQRRSIPNFQRIFEQKRTEIQLQSGSLRRNIERHIGVLKENLSRTTNAQTNATENPHNKLRVSKLVLTELQTKLSEAEQIQHITLKRRDVLDRFGQLSKQLESQLATANRNLVQRENQLEISSPTRKVQDHRVQIASTLTKLSTCVDRLLATKAHQFKTAIESLDLVSPLNTLARGYTVTAKPDGSTWGKVITSIENVNTDDDIHVHLSDGRIDASVTSLTKNTPKSPSS